MGESLGSTSNQWTTTRNKVTSKTLSLTNHNICLQRLYPPRLQLNNAPVTHSHCHTTRLQFFDASPKPRDDRNLTLDSAQSIGKAERKSRKFADVTLTLDP